MSDDSKEITQRKADHVYLASQAQITDKDLNQYFDYEPALSGFPKGELPSISIAGKNMKAPLWVSSMTGGTGEAAHINKNLATVCSEFGLGMGLGSCRPLLESDEYFDDFALRKTLGDDVPFFANLGIAQVASLVKENKFQMFEDLCKKLEVDGYFIHLNPMQEWFQHGGDRWYESPLDLIDEALDSSSKINLKVGVKEVGQGMGPKSLKELLKRPLTTLEFAAFGGTNFSLLETLRDQQSDFSAVEDLCYIGHNAEQMMSHIIEIYNNDKKNVKCESLIVSGGIRSFLQGHYLTQNSPLPAVYGMASPFLKRASVGLDETREFVKQQISGLKMANAFLVPKLIKTTNKERL